MPSTVGASFCSIAISYRLPYTRRNNVETGTCTETILYRPRSGDGLRAISDEPFEEYGEYLEYAGENTINSWYGGY